MAQDYSRTTRGGVALAQHRLLQLRIDTPLAIALALIAAFGLVVLNSAIHGDRAVLVNQLLRVGVAFALMLVVAQFDPRVYMRSAPLLYVAGLILLIGVLLLGVSAKGAQRWLDCRGCRVSSLPSS